MPTKNGQAKIREMVNSRIKDQLDKGIVPWVKPFVNAAGATMPYNPVTGTVYQGINFWMTALYMLENGWENPAFLTKTQMKTVDVWFDKGQAPCPIFYYGSFISKQERREAEEEGRPPVARKYMKYFSVWNVAQLKEISEKLDAKLVKGQGLERDYDKSLDKIWERACHLGKKYGITLERTDKQQAHYDPRNSRVRMPKPENTLSDNHWVMVLAHELSHMLDHKEHGDKPVFRNPSTRAEYARNELTAELTASYTAAVAGKFEPDIKNSASYIQGWSKAIGDDPYLFTASSARAQRNSDIILDALFTE